MHWINPGPAAHRRVRVARCLSGLPREPALELLSTATDPKQIFDTFPKFLNQSSKDMWLGPKSENGTCYRLSYDFVVHDISTSAVLVKIDWLSTSSRCAVLVRLLATWQFRVPATQAAVDCLLHLPLGDPRRLQLTEALAAVLAGTEAWRAHADQFVFLGSVHAELAKCTEQLADVVNTRREERMRNPKFRSITWFLDRLVGPGRPQPPQCGLDWIVDSLRSELEAMAVEVCHSDGVSVSRVEHPNVLYVHVAPRKNFTSRFDRLQLLVNLWSGLDVVLAAEVSNSGRGADQPERWWVGNGRSTARLADFAFELHELAQRLPELPGGLRTTPSLALLGSSFTEDTVTARLSDLYARARREFPEWYAPSKLGD